ncbi:MAG: hypothetical protein DRQ89_13380 [Epsilonproteobacteria bacterium]|nr:MAG: hypothetical protein DRQ89_13380 [Campylobacterota bacterium]
MGTGWCRKTRLVCNLRNLQGNGRLSRLLSSSETQWWRNLRGGETPVDIEIARQRLSGTAVLFEGDSEALREGVRRFISALPRDAKVYGLQLDEERNLRESSLASIAPRLVLVEISVDPL